MAVSMSVARAWTTIRVFSQLQPKTTLSSWSHLTSSTNRLSSQPALLSAAKGLQQCGRQLRSRQPALPVLTMYTKDVCPLCDDAEEELQSYRHRFTLEKVDITLEENKKWFKKYAYHIPVFHFNGSFLMKHRVSLDTLSAALAKWERSNS